MIRILILVALYLTVLTGANAQDITLNFYGAYTFDDRFDSYYDPGNYYEGKIRGGFTWGAGISYFTHPTVSVELLYLRQDTRAPTRYQYNTIVPQNTNFDLGINYILLGGSRHFKGNGKLEGFGGIMAGMVIAELYNPDNHRSSSATKFSWGLRGGGILWASEKVGIKLQAQLLSAVQSMGGGFYFGTGGVGTGISSYSTIYQFSLGGGLVIKIK